MRFRVPSGLRSRSVLRAFLIAVVVLSAVPLASAFFSTPDGSSGQSEVLTDERLTEQAQLPLDERAQLVSTAGQSTVVTNFGGPIVAFDAAGRLLYFNDTHHSYWDVDPSPVGTHTVMYSATDQLSPDECPTDVPCTRNIVERANLTTGETEVLYTRLAAGRIDNEWHDVDRVGPNRLLVADMADDLVFTVNTTTGVRDWTYDFQYDYDVYDGGSSAFVHSKGWPNDWTHVNDVELIRDGDVVMASPRNQDSVVFIHRERGLLENMTIGGEDRHEILYEQHNPDYIPSERGGPSVVVADSQNNRIVEYQRVGDDWERSWTWTDDEMLWPRDADRLPDGDTLITDTHSQRIIEVNESGAIIESFELDGDYAPYEAERLGTGDESAGGPSAVRADLQSRGDATTGETAYVPPGDSKTLAGRLSRLVKQILPNKLLNGLLFLIPSWLSVRHVPFLISFGLGTTGLVALEGYWRLPSVSLRSPVEFED